MFTQVIAGAIFLAVFVLPMVLLSRPRTSPHVARAERARRADAGLGADSDLDAAVERIRSAIPEWDVDAMVPLTQSAQTVTRRALSTGDHASCAALLDDGVWSTLRAEDVKLLNFDGDDLQEANVVAASLHGKIARVTVRMELIDTPGEPFEDWVWECVVGGDHSVTSATCPECGAPRGDDLQQCASCGADIVFGAGDWRVINVTPDLITNQDQTHDELTLTRSALLQAALISGLDHLGTSPDIPESEPRVGMAALRARDPNFDEEAFLALVQRTVAAVYAYGSGESNSHVLDDYADPELVRALGFTAVASAKWDLREPRVERLVPELVRLEDSTLVGVQVHGIDDRKFLETWFFERAAGETGALLGGRHCVNCGAPRTTDGAETCVQCGHAADGPAAFRLTAIEPGPAVAPDDDA